MTVDATPAPEQPRLMMGGTFAFYEGTKGSVVMVLQPDGQEPQRKVIPKMFVDMFMGKGGPMGGMLRKALGDANTTDGGEPA